MHIFTDKVQMTVLVLLLLLIPAAPGLAAGLTITAEQQYDYALERYLADDHAVARVEWQRFIHFFPDHPRIPLARHYLGCTLFYLEKWDRAARQFHALTRPYTGAPPNVEAFFMLAQTRMVQEKWGAAAQTMRALLALSDVPRIRDRAHSFLVWLCLYRAGNMEPGALERAAAFMAEISPAGKEAFHMDAVTAAIARIQDQPRKTPWLAGVASAMVPGGGFAYCGRYRDALAALVINGGLILAGHGAFKEGQVALGILLAVVEAGFYGGNIYGAVSSAHKFNRHETRKNLAIADPFYPHVPDKLMEAGPAADVRSGGIGFFVSVPF